MSRLNKVCCIMILTLGVLLISANALAVEFSPGYRIKTAGERIETAYSGARATLQLPGNSDIKGIAETGAAYNYLGIETSDGKSLEIGLTKDKLDVEGERWSVFAYANYDGAFSHYGSEGRWINFRSDGALFSGPRLLIADGSIVTISLQVQSKDEAVFEISGYEPILLTLPGAEPQGDNLIFRRVTSLMTDDPQGFFKNTGWTDTQVKKGSGDEETYFDWKPRLADISSSNNLDNNDPAASWVSEQIGRDGVQNINIVMEELAEEDKTYAFEIQSINDEWRQVQFVGNKMYDGGRQIGFGVNGRPMLGLRYMAETFGFRVAYDLEMGAAILSRGHYSIVVKSGSDLAGIYWAGEEMGEMELTERALLRDNVLYLYSLDIAELLGLTAFWDGEARTWDVLYRDYSYRELCFPRIVNDDMLTLKGLLLDDGQFRLPTLSITDTANRIHASFGSTSSLKPALDGQRRYEMSSAIQAQEKNSLRVSLSVGQRIIFAKEIRVDIDIESKELAVNAPYLFSSPLSGYLKISEPQVLIEGSSAGNNGYFDTEIALFAKKVSSEGTTEKVLKKTIPLLAGRFSYQLGLADGEGLYKVTVCSIMAGPRGPAYPEITNFYVDYRK